MWIPLPLLKTKPMQVSSIQSKPLQLKPPDPNTSTRPIQHGQTHWPPSSSAYSQFHQSSNLPIRFVAIGDWGSGQLPEYQVAHAITQQAQANPFQFVITLGDNFYPELAKDNIVQKQFFAPFNQFLRQNPVPWYASLGNHDKPIQSAVKQVFNMPNSYYTYQKGPIQFFVLNTNNFTPQQGQWLDTELKKSTSPWKVVYGHHPPYTSGTHKSNPHLINNLVPILENNKVNLYLNGHEHGYERLEKINGVQYVTSGGGGGIISQQIFNNLIPQSKVRSELHHFLVVDANRQYMRIQAITPSNQLIDEVWLSQS